MLSKLQNLSDKTTAALAGVFILTAYLMLITEVTDSEILGMIVEIVSGLSVIAIAVLLYPLFVKEDKLATAGYMTTRLLEGLVMVLIGIYVASGNYEMRDTLYENFHIYMFIAGAAFMYWLLYKSKLLPRFISIWGFVAVFFLSLVTILGWFDIESTALESTMVLIITNEIFMAVWLMTKGLDVKESTKALEKE